MIIKYSRKLKFFYRLLSLIPRIHIFYKISLWYIRHFFGFNYGLDIINSEFNLLSKVCKKKNALIFDVGGNHGQWSLMVLSKFPTARIHMFEPSSKICNQAKKKLNDFDAKINNFALSNEEGERKFYEHKLSELSSFHENDDKEKAIPTLVSITTIDSYCNSNDIDNIDFLKIDAEGHDFFVLEGAKNMLEKHQINYAQFEYGPSNIFSRIFLKDILEFMQMKDYRIFRIYPYCIKEVKEYSLELENFIPVNYIAVAPNQNENIKDYIQS